MARDRITEKDLNEAAESLSRLTGETFFVNFPNRVPTLYVKNRRGGCNNVFSGDSHRDLHDQIIRFEAGIQYGLNMAKEGKNPDLSEPKKALQRMSDEIGKINVPPGVYPAGLEEALDRISGALTDAIAYAAPLDDED